MLKICITQDKGLLIYLLVIQELDLKPFTKQNRIKQIKKKKNTGTGLKILTPKQIIQRLSIALVPVKTGNNSGSLLNEIRQIVYIIQKK